MAQDSQCLIINEAADTATATETQSEWMTIHSRGQEFLTQAEAMHETASAAIAKVKAEEVSGKFTEAQAKVIAEGIVSMARAKGMYMQAETHFKDARSAFRKEVNNLKREAKKKSIEVPESLDTFSNQLDETVKACGARVTQIDRVLKSVEKVAR